MLESMEVVVAVFAFGAPLADVVGRGLTYRIRGGTRSGRIPEQHLLVGMEEC